VAVYATHEQAHEAIELLSKSSYCMRHLGIIGQDYATEEQPVGFISVGDRMLSWGKMGAIWGLLFGAAFMVLPGLGIFMFAGWLVGALETSVVAGGLAAIGGALVSIGVPQDSVVDYGSALKAGSFLVAAHGS
jgi:hypothetical protein